MVRKQSNDVKQKRRSRRSIRHVGRLHHPEAAQSPAGCTYFSWWSGGCSSKTRRTTPAPFGCSICPSGRGSHTASSGGTAATSGRMRSDGRLRRSVAKLEYSYQHGLGVNAWGLPFGAVHGFIGRLQLTPTRRASAGHRGCWHIYRLCRCGCRPPFLRRMPLPLSGGAVT